MSRCAAVISWNGCVDSFDLATTLEAGDVRLEPLDAGHIEGLRAACGRDTDIWKIYPVSWDPEHFDQALAAAEAFHRLKGWVRFAVLDQGVVVGMTNYIMPDPANGVTEIGGTYIEPSVRATGLNRTMKKLMIDHAFACGFARIEFRVDMRNARSMAAVRKLGAVHEGTLRRNRITWTGYVRDTAVFGLLRDEWTG
jgi:RimJ/RimL family protein N-acetyltransferase